MTDPLFVEPVVPAAPAVPPVAPHVEATPPWGTAEEFNAETAWTLIKNLREQKSPNATLTKELSELRAKVASHEDEKRTDVEKAVARAEKAETALSKSTAEKLRADVAIEQKLTASQAKRLVGNTREELEADAIEMLADLKATTPVVPSATGQGGAGDSVHNNGDRTAADIVAEATKR